jgi:hypothetical protein
MSSLLPIWRSNLETGERVPFPVFCIACGRLVKVKEMVVDMEGLTIYTETGGCRPENAWRGEWPEKRIKLLTAGEVPMPRGRTNA